jgi:hypothetical protein
VRVKTVSAVATEADSVQQKAVFVHDKERLMSVIRHVIAVVVEEHRVERVIADEAVDFDDGCQ